MESSNKYASLKQVLRKVQKKEFATAKDRLWKRPFVTTTYLSHLAKWLFHAVLLILVIADKLRVAIVAVGSFMDN